MSQSISLVIRYSMNTANGEYHYAPAEHHSASPIICGFRLVAGFVRPLNTPILSHTPSGLK